MELLTPGVYVREVDSGPKPIQAAATSTAGFLGVFPFRAPADAVSVRLVGGAAPREVTWAPDVVDARGVVRDPVAAKEGFVAQLGLSRGQVSDAKAWLALHGHDVTVGKVGDQVRFRCGEAELKLDASVVSASGALKVRDAPSVEAVLDEIEAVFPAAVVKAGSPSDLAAPFGLGAEEAMPTARHEDYSVPAWPVTGAHELHAWLQSFFAQLVVDTGEAAAWLGGLPTDPEEAADRVYRALDEPDGLQQRFRAFLSQPTVFRFVAAVQGFFDNGGSKAFVYLLGLPDVGGSISGDPVHGTGLHAFDDREEVALLAAPGLSLDQQREVLEACERLRDRFAVLDGPAVCLDDTPMPSSDGGFGAMYLPWLTVRRPAWLVGDHPVQAAPRLARKLVAPASGSVAVPPSGHVAGLMARVDGLRGVHKAPANEVVWGITGLTQRIGAVAQGRYNERGLNVIRDLDDRGIRVWGARTLATRSNASWRYVNVRRLFLMLEQSILSGSQWAVFEPNDPLLWTRLRRDVTAFLYRQWRSGALFGRTAEEAFFVRCDEETNPREVIDAGEVRVRIGVCPVKPAEFVVFEVGQWDGGASLVE